jgi:hypothetical protein
MTGLQLAFQVHLTRHLPDFIVEVGPLFHRWLPDGKEDAIALTMPNEQEQIIVWLERRMVLNHGFLRWKPDGTAFDPDIMKAQGKLDGGVLFGEMNAIVSTGERAAIGKRPFKVGEPFGDHDPESEEYITAGRRITEKIQQRVRRLVTRLRTQYGQYWLEDLRPWDSRRMSLGTYCGSVLNLRWWNKPDASWYRFLPTAGTSTITAPRMPGRGFGEYLTEADWRELQTHRCQSDVDIGIQLLGAATEALDTGYWSYAFVAVAAALEFALAARVQTDTSDLRIKRALNRFDDRESLPARAAVVLLASGIQADAVSAVLAAIETRNKIAHEGFLPKESEVFELRAVMQTIRSLMQLGELKTPILVNINEVGSGRLVQIG